MVPIPEQVHSGRLVCPKTRQRLFYAPDGTLLTTEDGTRRYPVINGVPEFLVRTEVEKSYLSDQDGSMLKQYVRPNSLWLTLKYALLRLTQIGGDCRSAASRKAFDDVVGNAPAEHLCLSIGGGPHRVHHNLVNLNIGLFANVDVVADAYELPYRDASVDAIHCEAVLEHLEYPDKAAAEMFRVLAPGGRVFAATPFMFHFHGYPNHFQNFTTEGHKRLFERAGFMTIDFGPAVGPTYALIEFISVFAGAYLPSAVLRKLVPNAIRLVCVPLKQLDHLLHKKSSAAILAATTFVHCRKEGV